MAPEKGSCGLAAGIREVVSLRIFMQVSVLLFRTFTSPCFWCVPFSRRERGCRPSSSILSQNFIFIFFFLHFFFFWFSSKGWPGPFSAFCFSDRRLA